MSTESTPKPIECQAAITWGPGEEAKVQTITVDPPKTEEVRVKVLYTGVCETDRFGGSGKDPEGVFPVVLGHEGAGVVESVGDNVDNVQVGDHVILLYTAECRQCKFCKSGKTNLCQAVRATQGQGLMPDRTVRFHANGKDIFHFMGCSAFSQYTVVSKYSLVAVDQRAPMDKICLLGCGVTTGWGATVKTAKVEEGSTVAVFGIGCVGLGVIDGAVFQKAGKIIAVDINPSKQAWAKKFGATDFVNSAALSQSKSIVDHLIDMTDGGLDYTFDCTGNVKVMRAALEACHKGWGVCTVIGVAAAGQEIATRPFQLVTGRKWQGSAFGGVKGRTELPGMVQQYLDGHFKLDEYITDSTDLAHINHSFQIMGGGECVRCVVDMASSKPASESMLPKL